MGYSLLPNDRRWCFTRWPPGVAAFLSCVGAEMTLAKTGRRSSVIMQALPFLTAIHKLCVFPGFIMSIHPLFWRRLVTSFLVVAVLVLGMADTVLALTDSLDGRVPERCLSVSHEVCKHSLNVFTVLDAGDEAADLEQLLSFPAARSLPALGAGRAIPHRGAQRLRSAAPPLLRPPSTSV